jgi:hypothetical protein
MGDVLALAGLAHPVALDRLGEDDGGLARVARGRRVGRADLAGSWPAAVERPDLLVAPVATIAASSGDVPKKCSRT